ncbi:MAG: SMC-Scp complex subunit ScpB [Lachnospiraceae bacterium]|nr:SMC-Scp complex subunit ScpB [Lachnospiraceae bacterium]
MKKEFEESLKDNIEELDIAPESENSGDSDEKVRAEHPEAAISAILFAMGDSVEIKKLADAIGYDEDETRELIGKMKAKYERNKEFGLTIVELDSSVQMCSKTEMYEYLIKVAKIPKNMHLSDTALETLSIIAYKQPVTRAEVEKIRGVSCDHPINKLLEYGLITELGRLNAPGRPLLFGTTEQFLRSFGVKSLEDLPDIAPDRLEEFKKEAAEEVQLKLDI